MLRESNKMTSEKETPWIEKYRPEKFRDIKGQDQAVEKVKSFLKYFGGIKRKAILLYGPPGTGKTTIASVAAKESDAEIFEINASDLRNKDKIRSVLKPAVEQKSLKRDKKIILVDEVDGISETDRGGLSELMLLVEETTFPMIITANDVWNKKLSDLRKKCELVQLKELDYKIVREVILEICKKEKITIDETILTSISVKAKGDVRAAINDVQTISKVENPESIIFDERNKEITIFEVLKRVLKDKPTNETFKLFDSLNMSIDDIILWFEENIPEDYQGEELVRAYDLLSKVDVFRGRIHKQQYWRFLIYENLLMSYGIASAKKKPKTKFTTYKRPTRILKIWINNQKIQKKKSIAKKYAELVHVGEKRALNEFAIIGPIIAKNQAIQKELRLSQEEISYVEEFVERDKQIENIEYLEN